MSKTPFLFLFLLISLYGLFRVQLQETPTLSFYHENFAENKLPESVSIAQDRMLEELKKRENLHKSQSDVYQKAFYDNKFTRLPDIARN